MLPVSEIVDGYFLEVDAKISLDVGSVQARKLNRIIPCPNPKARCFYKLEDNVTPPILELPLAVCSLTEERQLTSFAMTNVTLASYEMDEFEAVAKSSFEIASWHEW